MQTITQTFRTLPLLTPSSPSMSSGTENSRKLDSLYDLLEKLTSSSSESDLKAFGAYFSPSASAYLWSMREDPASGRQAIVDGLRRILTESRLARRHVVSQVAVDGGSKVIAEMRNDLEVLGKPLCQPETAIATFDDDGLIVDFKLYCCWSHIVMIKQKIKGDGPYKPEVLAVDGHGCL